MFWSKPRLYTIYVVNGNVQSMYCRMWARSKRDAIKKVRTTMLRADMKEWTLIAKEYK